MPYKPKSLDDINSLYDSDISATRAIEQGRSKVKQDSVEPKVNVPETETPQEAAPSTVSDISAMVDEFIRSLNDGTRAQKPSRINIDSQHGGAPAEKPKYRPGIKAPRTGVQGLASQQPQSGPIVRNPSARQSNDERPLRSAQQRTDIDEGGPNYARQKAAAEDARRREAELAKKKKQEEYRRMLSGEHSNRRSAEDMDEFLSEYSSVMNDDEESRRARRLRRRAARPAPEEEIPEEEIYAPEDESDGFEDFFRDVTGDIPDEQRRQSYVLSSTQSDFDGMFDGTDMATLPYSAKQFIFEQKLMYEEKARRAREEYERRRAEEEALARAEQERIRAEAEERQRQSEASYLERENEYRRQQELLDRQREETARLQAEADALRADEEARLAEEERARAEEEARLAEEEARREAEFEQLKAERDRLFELSEQQRAREQQESERIASLEEQLHMMELDRQRMEQQHILAEAEAAEQLASEEDETLPFDTESEPEQPEYEAEQPALEDVQADEAEELPAEYEGLSKSEIRKLEKQRAKEELARNRAVEKQMVLEAKERAKAEKAERKAQKAAAKAAPAELDLEEADESEKLAAADEEAEELFAADEEAEAEAAAAEPKKVHNGARVFFRTVCAFIFIAVAIVLAAVAAIDPVFRLNYGEKAVIGDYYFFTSSDDLQGTEIKANDLVIVRSGDSAAYGEVVAYVDKDNSAYGFGSKQNVSLDPSGRTYYEFAQGGGVARENVVGVVLKTVPKIGGVLELIARYYIIVVAAVATLAILLLLIVTVAFRNRHKDVRRAAKQQKKAAKAEAKQAELDELARLKAERKAKRAAKKGEDSKDGFVVEIPDDESATDGEESTYPDPGDDMPESEGFESDAESEAEPELEEPAGFEETEEDFGDLLSGLEDAQPEEPIESVDDLIVDEDNGADVEITLDEMNSVLDGTKQNDGGAPSPAVDAFEDISSSDEELYYEDEQEEAAPYDSDDGTFFGDDGGVFGDFESFEKELAEEKKAKKASRKKKKKNKKHSKKGNDDQIAEDSVDDDVFGSL